MTLVEKEVTAYVADLERWKAGGAELYCTFGHHCWKPNASTYRGAVPTVRGVQTSHINSGIFSDLACHVYATEDGTVVPARPPTTWNCACQHPPRGYPWSALSRSLRELIQRTQGALPWDAWPNAYGFSVEIIGNFDRDHPERPAHLNPPSEDPKTSRAFATGLDVLAAVHRIWDIPVEHAYFHRDVAWKSCPGERVERNWYRDEIRKRLGGEPQGLRVTLDGDPLPCDVALTDGQARCDLRPVAEALGAEIDTQNWPEIKLLSEEASQ
jgi:hypothetical protein